MDKNHRNLHTISSFRIYLSKPNQVIKPIYSAETSKNINKSKSKRNDDI